MKATWFGLALALFGVSAGAAPKRTPDPQPAPIRLTLPDAVLIGLRQNRAIRSAYLQRIADRFALLVAEDVFVPKVSLDASLTRTRSLGVTTTSFNAAPKVTWSLPTGATLSGGLTTSKDAAIGEAGSAYSQLSFQVIQPLLRGAGYDIASATLRTSRIQEKIKKLTLAQSVIDNVTQIITAHRSLIEAQEEQRIAEESLARSRTLLETNRALIAAGRLAAVELVQSEASIAQQELALANARNTTDNARLALLTLLAVDPASRITAVDPLSAVPVTIDESKALKVALDRQPAYLSQLLSIETGKITLQVAKNQRLWDVSVIAGAGQSANGTGLYQSFSGLRGNKTDYTAGLQLSIPIFDPSLRQAEINATIALRQAELQADQLRQQTEQQVRNAVRSVRIQAGQLRTAKRRRELSAAQLDAELAKLQAGRSSNFEVVSFQNTLQQAQSTELSAVIAYLNALTTLDQALGTTLDTWQIELKDE